MIILYVILWWVLGLIGSGFLYAMQQEMFPSLAEEELRMDLGFSLLYSIFGLVILVVGFCISGFGQYGWWIWFKK